MRISKTLPQFNKEPSLFVVTGKQDAVFYKAYDGTIEPIGEFRIPKPKYSDREGHYRTTGDVVSSGGRERRDDFIIRDFLTELKTHLKGMHAADYSKMYVFAPSKVKNFIIDAVPPPLRKKTAAVIEGNFYKSTPADIIQKVAPIAASSQRFINPEAQKILDRSRQARDVVGGNTGDNQ